MGSKNSKIILGIFILSLVLRLYTLGTESIWLDEATSILVAKLGFLEGIDFASRETHPPLYYLLLHFWILIFSDSEFSVRLLSLIFGVAAVFMIYKVAELIFDEEIGIYCSILAAVSLFYVNYSQEARMYSLMLLLTMVSFYFFIKILNKLNFRGSIFYVLSSSLLMYTHFYGLFIIFSQNLIFIVLRSSEKHSKLNLKHWIVLQSILVMLYLPWVNTLIHQILRAQTKGFFIPQPSFISIIATFYIYSGSPLNSILYVSLAFFSLLKFNINDSEGDIATQFSENSKRKIMLLWLFTSIIIPFILSRVTTPFYWYQYTIGASPAFYLLVSKGIKGLDRRAVKCFIIALIIVSSLWTLFGYYREINKERWREAAEDVDKYSRSGDLLLFNAPYVQKPFDYYFKRRDVGKKKFPPESIRVDYNKKEQIMNVTGDHDRIWLILSHSDDKEELIKTISKTHKKTFHREYFSKRIYTENEYLGVEIYLFEKNNRIIHTQDRLGK